MQKYQKLPIMDFPTLKAEMKPFINCDFRLVYKLRLPTGIVKMGHIYRLSMPFFPKKYTSTYSELNRCCLNQQLHRLLSWLLQLAGLPICQLETIHSSRHVGTLGKSLTHSCLWRFGVKLRRSIHAVSGALLSRSGLEEVL